MFVPFGQNVYILTTIQSIHIKMKGITKLIYLLVIVIAFAFAFISLFNSFSGISILPAFVHTISFFGVFMPIIGTIAFMLILYGLYKSITKTYSM